MQPLTRWQRLIARLLPWYDPAEDERRIAETEAVVRHVDRIADVRVGYRLYGERLDRRKAPR